MIMEAHGEVVFEPLYVYTTPPAPEDLVCEGIIPDQVELSWSYEDILGFSNFNVYWSENGSEFQLSGTANETEFVFGPAVENSYYEFYVTATNVLEIESDSSGVIGFSWVGSEDNEVMPNAPELTVYPNPFNPSTTISLSLNTEITRLRQDYAGQAEDTEICIYNIKGQKVKIFAFPNGSCRMGTSDNHPVSNSPTLQFSITWDGTDANDSPVPSGVYFFQLTVNGEAQTVTKGLLLK